MIAGIGVDSQVQGVAQGTGPGTNPRLVNAAHEFEAQLMKELLKPLSATGLGDEDGGDGEDGSSGVLGEFASEALGQGLSRAGGFGMADHIVQQLSRSETTGQAREVTGNRNSDTELKQH